MLVSWFPASMMICGCRDSRPCAVRADCRQDGFFAMSQGKEDLNLFPKTGKLTIIHLSGRMFCPFFSAFIPMIPFSRQSVRTSRGRHPYIRNACWLFRFICFPSVRKLPWHLNIPKHWHLNMSLLKLFYPPGTYTFVMQWAQIFSLNKRPFSVIWVLSP